LFYWEYDDQQITYLTLDSTQTVFLTTQNVGKSTYKGVEIEAQIALGRGTQIKADVQYLDAVYKRFTYNVPNFGAPPFQGCRSSPNGALNTIDCSGRPAINAPKWRFNLGAEQAIQLGSNGGSLTLAANLKYQSGSFTNIDYIDQQFQGEFAILDAQIVYESPNGNWSVTGFAKNITNRAIKSFSLTNPSANEVLSSAALYAPRTYGLRLAFSF
jgi:iron complex outermembrane receptor protein